MDVLNHHLLDLDDDSIRTITISSGIVIVASIFYLLIRNKELFYNFFHDDTNYFLLMIKGIIFAIFVYGAIKGIFGNNMEDDNDEDDDRSEETSDDDNDFESFEIGRNNRTNRIGISMDIYNSFDGIDYNSEMINNNLQIMTTRIAERIMDSIRENNIFTMEEINNSIETITIEMRTRVGLRLYQNGLNLERINRVGSLYKFDSNNLVSLDSNDTDNRNIMCEDPKCCICLACYEQNDTLRLLDCNHHMHRQCIDGWLTRHNSCPLCRQIIRV